MSVRRQIGTGLYAGVLFAVLGLIAWASGQPFVFPSLGPTAFVLAFDRRVDRSRLVEIVFAHLLAGVAGLVAWWSVAPGAVITTALAPLSTAGLRLATSATVSVVLTTWGMLATGQVHPPACATTLIVSLGLLSTTRQVGIVVASVVTITLLHAAARTTVARVVSLLDTSAGTN